MSDRTDQGNVVPFPEEPPPECVVTLDGDLTVFSTTEGSLFVSACHTCGLTFFLLEAADEGASRLAPKVTLTRRAAEVLHLTLGRWLAGEPL